MVASRAEHTREDKGNWEWRCFYPLEPLAEGQALPLEGYREDVYFPAGPEIGVKLRDGKGKLEVKLRQQEFAIEGHAKAEKWSKSKYKDCFDKKEKNLILEKIAT